MPQSNNQLTAYMHGLIQEQSNTAWEVQHLDQFASVLTEGSNNKYNYLKKQEPEITFNSFLQMQMNLFILMIVWP